MAGKREAYDPSKDELIEGFGNFKTEKEKGVTVAAYSYDGGPIRVAVQRYNYDKDGKKRYYNAGRLNGDEIKYVIKGLKRARKWFAKSGEGGSKKGKSKVRKIKVHG